MAAEETGRIGAMWEQINRNREGTAELRTRITAQEKQSESIRVELREIARQLSSAVKLGFGLLGGIIVDLVLRLMEFAR